MAVTRAADSAIFYRRAGSLGCVESWMYLMAVSSAEGCVTVVNDAAPGAGPLGFSAEFRVDHAAGRAGFAAGITLVGFHDPGAVPIRLVTDLTHQAGHSGIGEGLGLQTCPDHAGNVQALNTQGSEAMLVGYLGGRPERGAHAGDGYAAGGGWQEADDCRQPDGSRM